MFEATHKIHEGEIYVGKTSSDIQSSFPGDVSRKQWPKLHPTFRHCPG